MKYSLSIVVMSLMGISNPANAVDIPEIYFTPRITGGAMYYEYEQDPVASGFSTDDVTTLEVDTKKMKFASLLATASVGGTLKIDRFYIDATIKHAFTEQDHDSSRSSIRSFGGSVLNGTNNGTISTNSGFSSRKFNTGIERTEGAVTTGYRAGNLTLFAGYKLADTDFRSHRTSTIEVKGTGLDFQTGRAGYDELTETSTADVDIDFEQKGPFVGFAYSVPIKRSIFSGSLSAKLAVAFMDGKTTITETNRSYDRTVTHRSIIRAEDSSSPSTNNSSVNLPNRKSIIDGDTVGLSLGVKWNGDTLFNNLGYSLGIEGHQYDFGANSLKTYDAGKITKTSSNNDFEEWSVNFNAGLKYTF